MAKAAAKIDGNDLIDELTELWWTTFDTVTDGLEEAVRCAPPKRVVFVNMHAKPFVLLFFAVLVPHGWTSWAQEWCVAFDCACVLYVREIHSLNACRWQPNQRWYPGANVTMWKMKYQQGSVRGPGIQFGTSATVDTR